MRLYSIALITLAFGFVASEMLEAKDHDASLEYVSRECNDQLRSIDSIAKFQEFMQHYDRVVKTHGKPKKGILNWESSLRKCYELEPSLRELQRILSIRHNRVCQPDYVEQLIEYRIKYLTKSRKDKEGHGDDQSAASEAGNVSLSYAGYFFSLYVHQIIIQCKSNLLERVNQVQQKYDCTSLLYDFMPQLFESSATGLGGEDEPQEIEQLLSKFKHIEDFAPIIKVVGQQTADASYQVVVPERVVEKIEKLKQTCKEREPHYMALFYPIASLSQLGYSTSDSKSTVQPESKLLQCWLATAQLCQGILRTDLVVEQALESDTELGSKLISIHWDRKPSEYKENSRFQTVADEFLDDVDEISDEARSLVKKKSTKFYMIKQKAIKWSKKLIERHIDIDGIQRNMEHKFLDALTEDQDDDHKVAFSGRKLDDRRYKPASLITDDADTLLKLTSPFWNKEIGLVVSCVVGVVMSGVFIWFSLYAIATTIKDSVSPNDERNLKADWRKLRDERVDKLRNKLNKDSMTDKITGGYKRA